jgi:hypothetical protein
MFRLFSPRKFSVVALSLSLMLGALVASPAASTFAKFKTDTTPYEDRRDAYHDKSTSTGYTTGTVTTGPYATPFPAYDRRADGKYTVHPR